LLGEVEAASHQVFLARQFYNDAVSATQDARRRPLVRLLRLAGKADLPQFFEMDDSLIAETVVRLAPRLARLTLKANG